jgi:hypothetical protein
MPHLQLLKPSIVPYPSEELMSDRTIRAQVKSGFRRAAIWLLGFAWLGLVFAGLGIAFTPSRHPSAVGWVLLIVAAVVLIITTDRWGAAFSALLAYGVIGGLLTIVSGHALNHPEVRVVRIDAVIMTLLIAASAVVSFTFTGRKLRLPDRIALLAFVFLFFSQAMLPRFTLAPLGVGLGLLVAAWAYDRSRRHDRSRNVIERE